MFTSASKHSSHNKFRAYLITQKNGDDSFCKGGHLYWEKAGQKYSTSPREQTTRLMHQTLKLFSF